MIRSEKLQFNFAFGSKKGFCAFFCCPSVVCVFNICVNNNFMINNSLVQISRYPLLNSSRLGLRAILSRARVQGRRWYHRRRLLGSPIGALYVSLA